MEPTTIPKPGVAGQSKHNISLVIGVMFILPPVGVYLLDGGCDFQVGINIVCWFFFITPSYIHGFGLLAFRKFYPKVKPYIDEAITNITTQVEKLAPAMTPIITAITGPGLPEAGNADVPKLGV